ncbi:hypothetical protein A1F94_001819 [Pyrenophora tritici-repentis]|uniref:Uncharacterized protein n=1 Tax=Pyrenophora tritici-repentis TaxID=45151 RepID=A0A834VWH5_9PLEO|nr:hypothetical protein PtrM4_025730 [Pyrenophora tritici-repentis]KAG9388926.1 hypothetical protein A1F94_001819 [Pyrenophora tritici-repentis]
MDLYLTLPGAVVIPSVDDRNAVIEVESFEARNLIGKVKDQRHNTKLAFDQSSPTEHAVSHPW